ncbi:MAG: hypothetical protein M1814_002205 [Vezdaea aestivalis]|nr:MAG: hypothetical protein M1814_002205 [Vezdaea aestivalis]
MPPSSRHSETNTGIEEHDQLTDHDFDVLYSIVATAQKNPDAEHRPHAALFAAYDTVLRQIGLEPDHDGVYFRYILRLGSVRGDGTLLEKFETLFEGMGIQIEYDEEQAQKSPGRSQHPSSAVAPAITGAIGKGRRSSFDSAYGGATTQDLKPRAASSPPKGTSGPRSRPLVVSRPSENVEIASALLKNDHLSLLPEAIKQTKLTSTTDASGESEGDTSSHGRLQQWQRSVFQARLESSGDDTTPALLPSAFRKYHALKVEKTEPKQWESIPRPLSYEPTESQQDQNAQIFRHRRILASAGKILQSMRDTALLCQDRNREMETKAEDYDKMILLRQSLDPWLTQTRQRRQAAQTERFYARLERRADKARDLYLLSKAFTHWAQCAHDEVQRTSTARRHILRTKFFKAWRDITVVNDFKVRRHGLKKFLSLWKSKSDRLPPASEQAVLLYRENLVRHHLREWFWKLCEKRAPDWRAQRIKGRVVSKMIDVFREHQEREGWVEGLSRRRLLYKTFRPWLDKIDSLINHETACKAFLKRKTISKAFSSWNTQTVLVPYYSSFRLQVESKAVRSAFDVWLHKARLSLYANEVNRIRVIQNCWTQWNDLLRIHTLSTQRDERIQVQALYKLVLVERQILLQRLFQRRLKQRIITRLVQCWSSQSSESHQREENAAVHYHSTLFQRVWSRWRLQMDVAQRRADLAEAFHSPKLLSNSLESLNLHLEHLQGLKKAADLARYFFLAKRSFQTWRDAVAASQKEKRRDAFARVRRRWKVHVRIEILALWRAKTAAMVTLKLQADEQYHSRLMSITISLFDTWRFRITGLEYLEQACEKFRRTKVPQKCLRRLLQDFRGYQEMEATANRQYQLHLISSASLCFRKLSMRTFECKVRIRSAEDFARRHERRTRRNIFRHWREQSQFLPNPSIGSPNFSRRLDVGNHGYTSEANKDATRLAEEFSELDALSDLGDLISVSRRDGEMPPVPRPGYLSTPSKRAAHAKALARLSTTTPAATPPRRILSFGQRSGLPTPGSRFSLAPSALGKSLLADRAGTGSGGRLPRPSKAEDPL